MAKLTIYHTKVYALYMLTLSSPLVVESHKGHSSSFPYSVSLKNQHQLLQSSEGGCIPSIESQFSMFTRMDTEYTNDTNQIQ